MHYVCWGSWVLINIWQCGWYWHILNWNRASYCTAELTWKLPIDSRAGRWKAWYNNWFIAGYATELILSSYAKPDMHINNIVKNYVSTEQKTRLLFHYEEQPAYFCQENNRGMMPESDTQIRQQEKRNVTNGYIFCSAPLLTLGFKFQLQVRTERI